MKSLFVAFLGIVSAIYLMNPGAGILEIIPDITPIIGNLDEVTAFAVLVSALGYFGFDLGFIGKLFGERNVEMFGKKEDSKKQD